MEDLRSDHELVTLIKNGDEPAFRTLIDRYRDRLVTFCSRYLGSDSDGEDIAQEVCVLLYEKLGSFKENAQFSTWLYRIAVNRCKNRHGSWWNRLTRNGKRVSSVDRDTSEITVIDDENSSDALTQNSELSEYIMTQIGELAPQFREVILLRDLQDHTYDEIAKIVDASVGTVKSRLSRGRKLLQTQLEGVRNEY